MSGKSAENSIGLMVRKSLFLRKPKELGALRSTPLLIGKVRRRKFHFLF
ncbi:hypothetical protein [Celeribacter persicus]|uniref:Uncharacterized protein n=1 Tax=Celeribacter persicus TaxID=1651082 RepID=A0A2T5H5I6_9RHOB|nr:hypothetical protein [Celeribacter persicus]PTQ66841.1 hypothetical protein C8N42_12229 [Celeribacter persicus]